MTPSMHHCFFLGGPMHGRWAEVADAIDELSMKFGRDRTFAPDLTDRYTRRFMLRATDHESTDVALLFAHETWLDEEIAATHIPDVAFVPSWELRR